MNVLHSLGARWQPGSDRVDLLKQQKVLFLRNMEALQKELGDENFFQSVLTQGFTTDSSKLLSLFWRLVPITLLLHFMYSIQFSWFESKIFPLSRPYQIKTELILRK